MYEQTINRESNVDIASLKTFYTQNTEKLFLTKSWISSIQPDWTQVHSYETEKEMVYEVGVENPHHVFISSTSVDAKTAVDFEQRSIIKLLFLENKKSHKLRACFMNLVVKPNYGIKITSLIGLRYKNFDTFNGIVNYYELDGRYANGWDYENGKIIAKLSRKMIDYDKNNNAEILNVLAPCGTYRQLHWRQACVSTGPTGVEYQNCTWVTYYTTETLYCPVGDDGGGGGGGYHPPNNNDDDDDEPETNEPTPATADTTKNPCQQANALAKNAKFKKLMDSLKNKVTDNKEYGYFYQYDNTTGSPVNEQEIEGEAGKDDILFSINSKIDGVIHSHYIGLYSVFSPSDLIVMANLYIDSLMVSPKTFTLGVVTASGTQYLLKIEDVTKFAIFANRITNPISSQLYDRQWKYKYKIKEDNTSSENEIRFLSFLQDTNSGLKLFKGNTSFSEWKPKKAENGTVTNNPCIPITEIED